MALFILSEDEGKKLNKKQIPIPKNVQKKLKSNLSLYNGYSQTKGYKRLNSLVDDDYNKRSQKSNKTKDGGKTLSFSDAKRIDHDMRHMVQNPKNLEYQMLGGDDTRNWLHDALGSVRNANKQVQKVPQVPKLQKNPEKVKDVDKDFKYGNANVRITESSNDWLPYYDYCDDYENIRNISEEQRMPKNIIITESQLQLLKEYHGDQLLPFDGNGNKMNVEHYIDFLEHIGRFGRLESQIGKNPSLLQKLLDKGHEEGLNEWTCDDYIEQSDERDSASKERNASSEERNSSSEDINSSTAKTSNSELIGNDDEIKLQLYNKHLSDFGFPDGLDIDENGLIYCERTITIPSPMETDSGSAYYEFVTNYDSVGKFWTWFEGHGQAYCGQEGEPITLIGRTRPEDIDWGETFYRNAYGLNEERELYLAMHSLVQINAIRLEDRTVNLPRPIVVPAHLEISPQDIRKTIAVSESQIQPLNEYHGDQLLPFGGNGNKMNIEHYIDFLEHIGRFGRLDSRLGKDKAQFQILLSQAQEDGFGDWYHNFDTSSFEDDGMELSEDDIRQLYYDKLSEYHFPDELDIDENGLIYCERTIKIPSPMKTAYDSAYYNYIVNYSSVGEYWTWLEGNGEAYCGSGGMDITLIGRTRPEDVNWDETFTRNAYELNEECELYLGYSSLVQINAIRLNDRVINLPRSIVVPAYSSVSPKDIYKSILPNRPNEKA